MTPFISINSVNTYCSKNFEVEVSPKVLAFLIENSILPIFREGAEEYVLIGDLESVRSALRNPLSSDLIEESVNLLDYGLPEAIVMDMGTRIELSAADDPIPAVFYAACRNLLSRASEKNGEHPSGTFNLPYFPPTRITSASGEMVNIVQSQHLRANILETSNASHFANSAYYMGSKRSLRQFLVESVSSCLTDKGILVDLMCGSGAATSGFSRIWKTYASDAQRFCQVLATVQGGGYTGQKAAQLLDKILPLARQHVNELKKQVGEFLEWEDRILHGDIGQELLDDYRMFLNTCPTYPDGCKYGDWDPVATISPSAKP